LRDGKVKMMDPRYGPVPMILGVTGHRDLRPQDVDGLRDVVRGVLNGFRERYPSTRLILLSSLAEGADRLVAREALDLGLSLVAPLPFEPHEFEQDFATPESIAEFRELLGRADESFVVPTPPASSAAHEVDARERGYAACSAFIVRRCVELIALWDGVDVPLRGTAEAVAFQLDGIPSPYVAEHKALDPILTGPVLHIATRRAQAADDAIAPFVVRTLYPRTSIDSRGEKAFATVKTDIERFNRDAQTNPTRGSEPAALDARIAAERLATAFQRRSAQLVLAVFASIFIAVLSFNAYQYQLDHPLWSLIVYLAFSACAFGVVSHSKRVDWQHRYQDYRALAEGLRVAHYWKLAGIAEPVADRYAQSLGSEMDWLPVAIRAVAEPFHASAAHLDEAVELANLRVVFNEWVVGQYQYFVGFAGRRDHIRARLATNVATVGIALSIVVTIATRLVPADSKYGDTMQTILFAAAVCGLGAALVTSYATNRGWSDHVKRYDFMGAIFKRARESLTAILAEAPDESTIRRARMILRGLGEEAIRESAAWLSLHRTRPLEVPKA
jgi:hypothetical protein